MVGTIGEAMRLAGITDPPGASSMFDEIDKAFLRQRLSHCLERMRDLGAAPGAAAYRRLAADYESELLALDLDAEGQANLESA